MQYDFDFDTGSGCVTPGAQTREASYSATPRRGSWSVVTTVSVTEAGGDGIITTEDEANFVSDRVLCWSRCFVIVGRSPTHLAQGGGGGQGGAGVGGHEVTPDVIHSPSGSGVCVCCGGRGRLGPRNDWSPSQQSGTDLQISRVLRSESS